MKAVGGTPPRHQRIAGKKPVHFKFKSAGTFAMDDPHTLQTAKIRLIQEVINKWYGFFYCTRVQVEFSF
jgi:hypothetical protein